MNDVPRHHIGAPGRTRTFSLLIDFWPFRDRPPIEKSPYLLVILGVVVRARMALSRSQCVPNVYRDTFPDTEPV